MYSNSNDEGSYFGPDVYPGELTVKGHSERISRKALWADMWYSLRCRGCHKHIMYIPFVAPAEFDTLQDAANFTAAACSHRALANFTSRPFIACVGLTWWPYFFHTDDCFAAYYKDREQSLAEYADMFRKFERKG